MTTTPSDPDEPRGGDQIPPTGGQQPPYGQPPPPPPPPAGGGSDRPYGEPPPPPPGYGQPPPPPPGYGQQPPYGQSGYPPSYGDYYAPGGYDPAAYGGGPPRSSTKAVAGLILSIIGLLVCPFIFSVIGLVLANQAKREIAESGGAITGRGVAQAAYVIAIIGLILWLVGIALRAVGVWDFTVTGT
jgi:hypothetical protein